MARTRIKICGITRSEDALSAVTEGADALGLNFYEGSARFVAPEVAAEIAASIPALVSRVGVFVDAPAAYIEGVLDQVELDVLQFHGDESPDFCASFGVPYIKALVADEALVDRAETYSSAKAILLDSHYQGDFGGTGRTFDWSKIPMMSQPLMLAGGLDPENVLNAVRQVRPYAVDVCGGVEAEKGVKDIVRIRAFVRAVQVADQD
jgi:phosphoribosylanthranilate isomerase